MCVCARVGLCASSTYENFQNTTYVAHTPKPLQVFAWAGFLSLIFIGHNSKMYLRYD